MFYRHGKFFILHILARRQRALLDKEELVLSDFDKTELSRVALELAELTYATAEAQFKGAKGYLSIFRSSTDAVPLARAVMQRLAELDVQQMAAVAAAETDGNSPEPELN